jgi:pimeloyl-ACP methyl ester carboxylesterase
MPWRFCPRSHNIQVYSQLQRLSESWVHPHNTSIQMYYTVAYDWRRDFWPEAARVLRMLQHIHDNTGCRVIVVGHSFGGRLAFTTIARYGPHAADFIAGVLYASSPFHGGATQVACEPRSTKCCDIMSEFSFRIFFCEECM